MSKTKVVFVRVGWLANYEGGQPIGGGKYNLQGPGSEKDNFLLHAHNILYGYFAIRRGGDAINLFRVDGISKSVMTKSISDVLVIFVSKNPDEKSMGPKIVGWYRGATLYREQQRLSETGRLYRAEADDAKATLVGDKERHYSIPRASPRTQAIGQCIQGIGQSNIFYPRDESGRTRSLPWIAKALRYVDRYDATRNGQSAAVIEAEAESERNAGYMSDSRSRKVIDNRAMKVVFEEYRKRGVKLINRSRNHPYDYSYDSGGAQRYIEVKGTQSAAPAFILTKNEVDFAGEHSDLMELCIVHSIKLKQEEGGEPDASGGTLQITTPWNPRSHTLKATYYSCKLKNKKS